MSERPGHATVAFTLDTYMQGKRRQHALMISLKPNGEMTLLKLLVSYPVSYFGEMSKDRTMPNIVLASKSGT
ncbi:MAG: hypothetical protein KAI14_03655, partial [Dehalococcoidales bacterium]|nr:hypothetical protein [Dehalococcoidales bacterium]